MPGGSSRALGVNYRTVQPTWMRPAVAAGCAVRCSGSRRRSLNPRPS